MSIFHLTVRQLEKRITVVCEIDIPLILKTASEAHHREVCKSTDPDYDVQPKKLPVYAQHGLHAGDDKSNWRWCGRGRGDLYITPYHCAVLDQLLSEVMESLLPIHLGKSRHSRSG